LVGEHPVENIVLRRIPEAEFLTLEPHLQFIALKNGFVLEAQGAPIESGYFLNSGIASLIVATSNSNGKSVEWVLPEERG
jgi:CRP-like cAMP-binding protein